MIAPRVAVIGGGPLARMLAEPAAALGIPLRLVVEDGDDTDGCVLIRFDRERRVWAEAPVGVRRHLSALVARSPSGQIAAWPVVASDHRDGICREVIAPAPDLDPRLAVEAQQIAMSLAGERGVVGVLAVELLETNGGQVLVGELAMQPHETGLWTQDGSVTSQFENQLRAVLDLPLGAPEARAPWTVTATIVAGPATARLYDGYPHALARDPRVRVHLYGTKIEPGRSVGHITAYGDDLEDCLERARHAAAWFAGELGEHSE